MLETVMRWHGKEDVFNKECSNYPGFVTKFRVSNQCSDTNDHVGFENFRHVCHKWHFKITKSIVTCLSSKDYIQIRNAFVILMHIQSHFPVLSRTEQVIQKRVEKVRDEEKNKRQDLHVLASSYLAILKSKSNSLIEEHKFHQVNEKAVREQELKTQNGDSLKNGKFFNHCPLQPVNLILCNLTRSDKKLPKDRERSEKKIIKITAEREIKKETPIREASRDKREPTPRDKLLKEAIRKEEKREATREREESENTRKRDGKEAKERRREKRQSSPPADAFEGDLSSVSNSSNGSAMPNPDLIVVDDHRGEC